MTAKQQRDAADEPTFEAALERLEAIVGDMEDGELALDEMIRRFDEGQKLVAFCTRKLDAIDHTVEKLVKQGERLTTVPLKDAEGSDAAPSAETGPLDGTGHTEPPARRRDDAGDELF